MCLFGNIYHKNRKYNQRLLKTIVIKNLTMAFIESENKLAH